MLFDFMDPIADDVDPMGHIISLGAGVQSSALYAMACLGEIEPRPIAAVFADTGNEPLAVYRHLDWLRSFGQANNGPPIITVSAGDIVKDHLRYISANEERLSGDVITGDSVRSIPLYADNDARGIVRRQCTAGYKLEPIRRQCRAMGAKYSAPVVMWIGITIDEVHRAKPSRVKYIRNAYPFLHLRMTRHDCLQWYKVRNYPTPPRSACVICPYRSDRGWKEMKENSPEEFRQAVEFDERIRVMPRFESKLYLHKSRRPLGEVEFLNEMDHGQLDMFGDECEGMCGV